jgi:hypothetical protein
VSRRHRAGQAKWSEGVDEPHRLPVVFVRGLADEVHYVVIRTCRYVAVQCQRAHERSSCNLLRRIQVRHIANYQVAFGDFDVVALAPQPLEVGATTE